MIRYEKEDIGGSGLTLGASAVLDGKHEAIKDGKKRAFNAYDVGLTYEKGPLTFFSGYQHTDSRIIYVRRRHLYQRIDGCLAHLPQGAGLCGL